jgi:hypothetical protein
LEGQARTDACRDPYNVHAKLVRKGLRYISEVMRTTHHHLQFKQGDKLCTDCRKRLTSLPETDTASHATPVASDNESKQENSASSTPKASASKDLYVSPDHELSLLNETLTAIGESPIVKRKMSTRPLYAEKKAKAINTAVKKKLELVAGKVIPEVETLDHESEYQEMIGQLKDKFKECKKRSERVQVLTVLPRSWTVKRIEQEFETTNYIAKKAKKLVKVSGILSRF